VLESYGVVHKAILLHRLVGGWVKECGVARVALCCQVAASLHPNEWGWDDNDRQSSALKHQHTILRQVCQPRPLKEMHVQMI
jgi:hypothetical protein